MNPWKKRQVLITVKAYPTLSKTHGESVCTAGITQEEGWIRLYPINYRELDEKFKFKKYDIIELDIKRRTEDPRPESYTPKIESIEISKHLGTGKDWLARRQYILPTASESMCQILKLNSEENKSLGMFKVETITDLSIEKISDSPVDNGISTQLSLWNNKIKKLEKIPYKFRLSYKCNYEACTGHRQEILDWEIGELYRNLKSRHEEKEVLDRIKRKYLDDICSEEKDIHLFVGNHSRWSASFMILGFFSYNKKRQLLFIEN